MKLFDVLPQVGALALLLGSPVAMAAPEPLAPLDFLVGQWTAPAPQTGKSVEFTSEGPVEAPAFRLSYEKKAEKLLVRFEIAPPGTQRSFKTYAEGPMNRQL